MTDDPLFGDPINWDQFAASVLGSVYLAMIDANEVEIPVAEIAATTFPRGAKSGTSSYRFESLVPGGAPVFIALGDMDKARVRNNINSAAHMWAIRHGGGRYSVRLDRHPVSGVRGFMVRQVA